MKYKYMRSFILVIAAIVIMGSGNGRSAIAGSIPDPESLYSDWKSRFVTSSGASGYLRVRQVEDNDSTVSEAQGYGLLLSSYRNDKTTFDKLLFYTEKYLDKQGLMHWKIDKYGNVVGENAATDGDEDIAYALLAANSRWGEPYGGKARIYIENIFRHEVEGGTYVLKPGDVWGGSNITNLSYCAPAYYRVFAEFTGNSDWQKVIDRCYDLLEKARNGNTGLVPDWTTINGGSAVDLTNNPSKDNFSYNAIRVPWRLLMDYKWFSEPRAYEIINLMAKFFADQAKLYSGYTLSGTPTVSYFDSAFAAGIASAAAGSKENAFASEILSKLYSMNPTSYYGASVRTLVLLLISGNFPAVVLPDVSVSKPELPSPPLPPPPTPTPLPEPEPLPQPLPEPIVELPPVVQYVIILEDPDDSQEISGEKKIKAYIDNFPLTNYTMTYSVDGSAPVTMTDAADKFKQVKVQFDNWAWNGRGPYLVTLTARDRSSANIGSKNFILFVRH